MSYCLSIDEVYEENEGLHKKIKLLESQVADFQQKNTMLNHEVCHLKERICVLIDDNAIKILNYFSMCLNIRKTAWKFSMEMEELYVRISEWDDTSELLESACDYDECRIEVIGRKEYDDEEEDKMESKDLIIRKRIPNTNEINQIISDYSLGNLSLYELADRYDLKINILFIVLKETGMIEKETDAKGYESFYTEYLGAGCDWDGKSDLGLI
jgi:hypothetical protein